MIGVVVGLAAEARVARGLNLPVEVGGGGEDGAARAAARLVGQGATSLISFGLCGGLDPALAPGALVLPHRVLASDGAWDTDTALRARLGPGAGGPLHGGGALLATAAGKRAAHRSGAIAVDLESAAVARTGLPFAVLRAVCDPAGADLPRAAAIALDAQGRIQGLRVLAAVLRRPRELGRLLALARDAARARAALRQRVRAIGALA